MRPNKQRPIMPKTGIRGNRTGGPGHDTDANYDGQTSPRAMPPSTSIDWQVT